MAGSIIGAVAKPIVGGIVGDIFGGGDTGASAADPFASQRPMYQKMLANLMMDPSSIKDTPGYKFALEQGTDALSHNMATSGQLNSGARMAAVQKFGTGLAEQTYQQQMANLMALSGATMGSPAAAGQLTAAGAGAGATAASGVANAISTGITNWWNKPQAPADSSPDFSGGGTAFDI